VLHGAQFESVVAYFPAGSWFCGIATQELPSVGDIGDRVGVTIGWGAGVGKGAGVGDGGPILHELPDPPHLFGKNLRTSFVTSSSNFVANFL